MKFCHLYKVFTSYIINETFLECEDCSAQWRFSSGQANFKLVFALKGIKQVFPWAKLICNAGIIKFLLQIYKCDFPNINLNLLFKCEFSQQMDKTRFQGQIRVSNLLFMLLYKSGGAHKIIHLLTFDSFLICCSDIRVIVDFLFSLCVCRLLYLLSINRVCVCGLDKS